MVKSFHRYVFCLRIYGIKDHFSSCMYFCRYRVNILPHICKKVLLLLPSLTIIERIQKAKSSYNDVSVRVDDVVDVVDCDFDMNGN